MSKLTRRGFLGQSAAIGGLAFLPSIARADNLLTAPLMNSTSKMTATHWGIIKAYVDSGRFARVEPYAKDAAGPSPVIQAFSDRVYSSDRIKYPMVREGFLKYGAKSDTSERGKGKFVRVSWDKAFELVASELQRVKKTYGNEAIHSGSVDWHSVGKLHNAPVLLRRMLGQFGGFVDNSGDFSIAAAMVILPHVIGGTEVYDQPTAWETVLGNTDTVVLWGATLLKNNQIGWEPTDHTTYQYLPRLKASGKKIISIDPRMTDTAKYLGADWVAPRPNTDTALMLGLMHTLYSENLYDADFIKKYTVGFNKFLPYLLGKDGTPAKTAEWAAQITTIPADTIRDLARTMAKGRTMLMSGWAIQRQDHGEQSYWSLITLAAMLGDIGLPGGGFGLSYHYANGGSLTANGAALGGISAGENAVSTVIPFAHGLSDMLLNPGKVIDYNGEKITYPDIKLVYWAGGNPLSHQMDRNRQIKAWQRPETIIVNEIFWTNTAQFADIVLPVNTTFERNDIVSASEYSNHYLTAMHKLIESQHQSKSDYEIFAAIAEKLGFGDKYTEGKTEMDWIRSFYDEAQTDGKKKGINMPDFETFWERDEVFEFPIPNTAKDYVRYSEFRADPIANALGTPSGKIHIFSRDIEGFKYDDCPPFPTWLEPIEWLGSNKTEKHPLHIVSPHPKYRLHSQMDNTWLRSTYEVKEREPVWINPEDAKQRGINDGQVVRVFNDRGATLAGAIVTDRIRQGVVMLQEGAWYDPDKPGEVGAMCKHGNINVVTLDKGTSKLAQGNIANTALVEIEPYEGVIPAITAFTPPMNG
ncbi:Trimethylamine-N-oxide reductase, TorZ [hydrothermal vent metagenome]|uniref:trimethylamine-N-oxide reductase n=1 Tax=hydrothermal vent metagenome TaxID=652676 RepID=A0A3B0U3U7_9ZZZZ